MSYDSASRVPETSHAPQDQFEGQLLDLAIIGAGIYGLQAARTYLELHPGDRLIVLESSGSIGGVWSRDRVYDGFMTQTPLGILEFSDMPLKRVPEHETYHGFFPASHVAEYLEEYARSKCYAGRSMYDRIKFATKVELLEQTGSGWALSVRNQEVDRSTIYIARKVIDATGLTSTSKIPNIPGLSLFQGWTLHSKDFAKNQPQVLSRENIVLIGGGKSAADIVYACAKAGRKVTWIIRRNGSGPAAFVSAKAAWPYKNSNESFYTRFVSHFLVSWFFEESSTWLGKFLYRTRIGESLIKKVWEGINRKARDFADYDRADGRENGFYNLKPDLDLFWQNDSTGICQRDDFFDVIAQQVRVYREDIKCMHSNDIELANGELIKVDTLVFATGWLQSHPKIRIQQHGEDKRMELGLSVRGTPSAHRSRTEIEALIVNERARILARFPILRAQPPHSQRQDDFAPLQLYKGVIPLENQSIAFVGQMLCGNNFRLAEVQALYATAVLDGKLVLPSQSQMRSSVASMIAWDRLRYLTKGRNGSWIYWDLVPYTDNLLRELGLSSHLHKHWWSNLFKSAVAEDLRGLLDEYRVKHRLQL